MIKAAVFDVDGTLLDSMGIWDDAGVRYLKSIAVKPEEDLSKILFPMTIEEGAVYVKKQYRLSRSIPEIVKGVLNMVRDFYYEEAPLKEGAESFLDGLSQKGIPMAAATSNEKEHVEAAFRRLGIRKYFKEIITCSEVGAGKTRPHVYLTAGRCLGEDVSEIYVFEDAFYALRTAKAAGFRTAGVYDRYSAKDLDKIREASDIFLPNLSDFKFFWERVSEGEET